MTADGGVLRIDNRVLLLDQARMDGIRNVLAKNVSRLIRSTSL